MPAIDMPALCIPAECDTTKYPFANEIASRWDAYCYATFAGISLRSFRITFAAYLPTHIKFLTEFHAIAYLLWCNFQNSIYSFGVMGWGKILGDLIFR